MRGPEARTSSICTRELQKIRCLQTGESFFWQDDLDETTPHPKGIHSSLRPDIVWFGEMPMHMAEIEELLSDCDVFLSIGTSGNVYPAAGFVNWTKGSCYKVEFNTEETPISEIFDRTIIGPAAKTVTEWCRDFLTTK